MVLVKKKLCDKCNRDISLSNFNRHSMVCNGLVETKYPWDLWKIADNLYQHPDGYIGTMAQVKLFIYNSRNDKSKTNNLKHWNQKRKLGKVKSWNSGLTVKSNPENIAKNLILKLVATHQKFATS
jgi:hypothetical protein